MYEDNENLAWYAIPSRFNPLSLLYRLYERGLLREVRRHPMPCHIGLILDGNRRYARELGLEDPLAGHRIGADKLEEVLEWLEELQIRITTMFALSTENLTRSPTELTVPLPSTINHPGDNWMVARGEFPRAVIPFPHPTCTPPLIDKDLPASRS